MSRDAGRWFTLGFLTAVVLAIALMYARDVELTAAIAANAAARDSARADVRRLEAANDSLRQAQRADNATADRESARAERVTAALGVRIVEIALPPVPGVGTIGEPRTGRFVPLGDYLVVKGAWEAERTARLRYEHETVPGLEAELAALRGLVALQDTGLVLRDRRIAHLERRGRLYLVASVLGGLAIVVVLH